MTSRFLDDPLRHEIAVMIFKSCAPVELERGIAVIDFEVNHGSSEFLCLSCKEFQNPRADALSAIRTANEEFIDPRAPAAIFEAVVEGHHDVTDRLSVDRNEPDAAQQRIAQ